MSKIRLWKLGRYNEINPHLSIIPDSQMINKFRTILSQRDDPNKTYDLVWGPDIECQVIEEGKDYILEPEILPDGQKRFRLISVGEEND